MSAAGIRIITSAEDPALAALPGLFEAMHGEMAAQGMGLTLVQGGARLWLQGVCPGLERFGRLIVAQRGGTLAGFAHAAIKLAPEHLGGERIGHITHVYVAMEHRRGGIARSLVENLHGWLKEKAVASIELQVVHRNSAALAFWRSLGYRDELVQLRRS